MIMPKIMSFFVIFLLVLVSPFYIAKADVVSCESVKEGDSDQILKEKLQRCEKEIEEQKLLLRNKERQSTNLERDLAILDYKINKIKLEAKARSISIANLDREIDNKNDKISELSEKVGRMKMSVAELVRRTNELGSTSLAEVLLSNSGLSDFFSDLNSFDSIQSSLNETFDLIKESKNEEELNKKILENRISKEKSLKALQEIERRKLEVTENEKNRILLETKGEEKRYKNVLVEKQRIINEIKNRILKITGGGELRFEEALKLVRVAEQALGIRAALILAVLTQESGENGLIGKNLGRCYYNTPINNKSGTVMSDAQKPSFLFITSQLGLDPDKTPVSCPIQYDGQYGGAMGPSQFMPKTWWDVDTNTGYKTRVEEITGSQFASPFNNLEAFTGTALYLNDALGSCDDIYKTTYSQESCAAAKYYAGGNWRKHMNGYGARVANRAMAFQKDIDILDSQ